MYLYVDLLYFVHMMIILIIKDKMVIMIISWN